MAPSDSGFSRRATGASGKRARAALCATLALAPSACLALFDDRLELWAAENVTHDTNVLRLSKNLSTLPPGITQRGDVIETTHLGATLNGNFSQQHVTAEYTWFKSNYKTFKGFDFNGHTFRSDLQWVLNPGARGTLGYVDNAGLGSFANIQSNDPDFITSRNLYITGNYLVTPRWRLSGGLTGVQTRHSSAARKVNDIDTESGEVGLAYITPLDNAIGAVVRVETGRLPNGIDLGGIAFDNKYRQYGAGGTIAWIFTGHSRFDGRIEEVSRKYDQATTRNYSGPILRATYTWTPTGKVLVVGNLSRDVGPADDIQTSFVLVTGGYVRPRWNITDKITLQGNAEYNVWDYRGDPVIGGAQLKNKVRTFGASILWRPYMKVLLQAGVNREDRTSNTLLGDYEVVVAFIEGRIGF